MYEGDALLVDGNEQVLRVVGVRRLLHLEERRPERWPAVDHLQERDLRVLGTQA